MLSTVTRSVRLLRSSVSRQTRLCSDQAKAVTPAAKTEAGLMEQQDHSTKHIAKYTPDPLDKKILVHFKYYPSFAEVPDKVPEGIMARAKSQARISIANIMILFTILGACITIYFAKKNSRQNSLLEENQRRHLMYARGSTGDVTTGRLGLVTGHTDKEE